MPRDTAQEAGTALRATDLPDIVLHVHPDKRRHVVTVVPGRDSLKLHTTGYHSLRKLSAAFVVARQEDRNAAIGREVEAIMAASGLESEELAGSLDLSVPVPFPCESLTLLLAIAVQKALERSPGSKAADLDFANIVVRQGRRGTYLVEVRRWCSVSSAAFLIRRLPSTPRSQMFEVRF